MTTMADGGSLAQDPSVGLGDAPAPLTAKLSSRYSPATDSDRSADQQLRAKRGITQLQLAQRARVAQGYFSSLEVGRLRSPGIETLRKLAKALGVPVTRLLA
jgi:DNA-binding XRE family transcriptional regulator